MGPVSTWILVSSWVLPFNIRHAHPYNLRRTSGGAYLYDLTFLEIVAVVTRLRPRHIRGRSRNVRVRELSCRESPRAFEGIDVPYIFYVCKYVCLSGGCAGGDFWWGFLRII